MLGLMMQVLGVNLDTLMARGEGEEEEEEEEREEREEDMEIQSAVQSITAPIVLGIADKCDSMLLPYCMSFCKLTEQNCKS